MKRIKRHIQRVSDFARYNKYGPAALLLIALFIGGSLLLVSRAVTPPTAHFEAESATLANGAVTASDVNASGGSYIKFATPPPVGSMPTASNTGPAVNPTQTMTAAQFESTRTCNNKHITDMVNMGTNGLGGHAGQTFTITNCVFDQGWIWNEDTFNYALSQYPTINVSYSTIDSSFAIGLMFKGTWDHVKITNGWQLQACGSCAGTDFGVVKDIPFTMTNSYIYAPPMPASTGCVYHSEAFHGIGGGSKYSFTNTRFVQDGVGTDPFAYCHTGTIYQQGGNGIVYDNCYFDDGQPGQQETYFISVNIDGSGGGNQNVVKNSHIERGGTYADNPAGGTAAIYTNNFDFNTGAPITIP